jgi:transposase
MGSKVHLVHHLEADELHRLYKEAKDATERTHLQIIWLLTSGRSAQFVAEVTGYTPRWISVLVGRYNEAGVAGLGDQRQFNPGARPLLDASQRQSLRDSLEAPPPDYGLWTGRSVAQWIAGMLGRLVSPRRGTEALRRLGFTRQVPRPQHAEADPLAQEVFKAHFRRRVQALQQEEPGTPLEVWAMDEHRVGLKPVLRRVWAPRGCRPIARGHHRFEWMYIYGFVRPSTGEVVWFLADGVGAALFSRILAAFAREIGAGADKRILLLLDGAGWHGAGEVDIPAGVTLEFLPPYSPELQPAERLWPLTNEAVANTHFADLTAVDQALADRCCALANAPERLKAVTWFQWWPQFA